MFRRIGRLYRNPSVRRRGLCCAETTKASAGGNECPFRRTPEAQPGELAVVGSSRLARKRRLFLGATAAKMLRELPVPMIVVPRTRSKRSKKEAGE